MLRKYLGGEGRMDYSNNKITLYALQADLVIDAIKKDGVCFSKKKYVEKKYVESAAVFTTAYSWFVNEAGRFAKKPDGAEYPYWAFKDLYNVDQANGGNVLKLEVPLDEVVLFDVRDWNRIMCLKYLGKDEKEEAAFREKIAPYGVLETKIMLTNFYPDLKREVMDSWQNLFRNEDKLKNGEDVTKNGIQAGLWQIKKEWIVEGL